MKVVLHIWRQARASVAKSSRKAEFAQDGKMVRYELDAVSPDMSFLEMLDVLNEQLISGGEEPVAFDHDCREGICGACGVVIDGVPHGPERGTTTCQLHMRSFKDGAEIRIDYESGNKAKGSSGTYWGAAGMPQQPHESDAWRAARRRADHSTVGREMVYAKPGVG